MLYLILILAVVTLIAGAYYRWLYVPTPAKYSSQGKLSRQTISVGGLTRRYLLYTPAHLPPGQSPVVFVLHGSNINAQKMRTWTGYDFDRLADEHGYQVIYPDAIGGHWNDIRIGGTYRSKKDNIDDVGFLKNLADQFGLKRESSFFAFGYSNGGVMLYRLIAEYPGLFSAVAIVGANLPVRENRLTELSDAAPPLILISGTKDPIIPYQGGSVKMFGRNLGQVISAEDTARYYAESHGTTRKVAGSQHSGESFHDLTRVNEAIWLRGEKVKVKLYTIENGGHVVPSAHSVFPALMGRITRQFDAVETAIDFFGLRKVSGLESEDKAEKEK
jgi:polyhydroxybutyrate depolymerase